jgi:hypothetical protein
VLVLGGLLLAAAPPAAAARPPDTVVARWDATATAAVSAAGLTPPEGHVLFAYVAAAEYDAVMAIQGDYQPFLVDYDGSAGASAEAAVAAAAHGILVHYLPAQAASILDPAYLASLAAIPDGAAEDAGVAIGTSVAGQLIALRADDGYRAPGTYTPPTPPTPGAWLPTASTPPIGVTIGRMRPLAIESADQFRPAGPPALGSKRWARDYNEVKAIGSRTSTTRTADQTTAARFWAEAPVPQARRSFREFVLSHDLDIVQAARFMAMVSVTYADAIIACWDAKYHYSFWRPVTAIPAGATDGNARTAADPGWLPLLAGTPNHPEYPSAHSCITPAGGYVIQRFLGTDQIDFTVPSLTGLGDRHFATVKDLQYDVMNARIWGGIHYRSAVVDGAKLGFRVAHDVLAHNFKPVDD